MSVPDEKGNPPLWLALENNLEDIASTLVRGNGTDKVKNKCHNLMYFEKPPAMERLVF